MAETTSVIEIVQFMAGAVDKGQAIVQFFQGGQPTAADIAQAVAAEVQQIFETQLAQDDILHAISNFQTAQQFFSGPDSRYQHAAKHGKTNAELLAMITGASGDDDGPGLRDLRDSANLMANWVKNPSLVGRRAGQRQPGGDPLSRDPDPDLLGRARDVAPVQHQGRQGYRQRPG